MCGSGARKTRQSRDEYERELWREERAEERAQPLVWYDYSQAEEAGEALYEEHLLEEAATKDYEEYLATEAAEAAKEAAEAAAKRRGSLRPRKTIIKNSTKPSVSKSAEPSPAPKGAKHSGSSA